MDALSYKVAEQYINAFGQLARTANTVLLPSNAGDVPSMVAQAMTLYRQLSAGSVHPDGGSASTSTSTSSPSSPTDTASTADGYAIPRPAGDKAKP